MNRVHEHHRPERYAELRHYVFAFHDSTFECVARGFDVTVCEGSIASAVTEMARRLSVSGA